MSEAYQDETPTGAKVVYEAALPRYIVQEDYGEGWANRSGFPSLSEARREAQEWLVVNAHRGSKWRVIDTQPQEEI